MKYNAMSLSPGKKLGPYEIISLAGSGGMGEVYKAKDSRLNRTVAIKVLPQHLADNADALKRFEAEARAVSGLNHPHICTLFDIGSQNGLHYMVMEYLEGETLRTRLMAGALSLRKTVELASQIASGLGAAHEKGVVHRDLKPENIFLTREDRVKILDFGLAYHAPTVAASDVSVTPTRSRMTEPGMVLGTVGYMSPEQVRGQEADARSDIFSLGAVIYEMLTGHRAFHRETSAETMTAILKEDPPSLNEDFPPAVGRILQRCLEKRAELRFQNPQDLAFALEMSGSQSGASIAIKTADKKRITPIVFLTALLLAALIGGFLIGKMQMKQESPFFKQLTFKRGYISSGQFAPDGTTVVYSSAQSGGPLQLYSTRTDGIESRSLELPAADILGISRSGEMAILLNRIWRGTWVSSGTLAKVSLAGGAPREILENINDGDISADGNDFCIVRDLGTTEQLEYPIGKVLFKTFGYVSAPRISPDGKRVAFADHPIYGDNRGYVALAENGKISRLTDDYPSITGIAWAPNGEIWFSGSQESEDSSIWEVAPGKRARNVLKSPAELRIHSIDPTGQALISNEEQRAELGGLLAGDTKVRDLSWYGNEDVVGISADATIIAAAQTAQGSGKNYQIYIRHSDGSGTVQLGEGNGEALSSDGKWVFATIPSEKQNKILVYPTGLGEKKIIHIGDLELSASKGARLYSISADGKRVSFLAHAPGQPLLAYVMDFPNGKPRAITSSETVNSIISQDGNYVVATTQNSAPMIYPFSGGQPQLVHGMLRDDFPIQWHSTKNAFFVWDRTFPIKVYMVDLAAGTRELWKEIAPPDPTGVLYGRLFMTPDGKHYIYRFRRILNRLYLAKGLK